MKDVLIGDVCIEYHPNGDVKSVKFVPIVGVELTPAVASQLKEAAKACTDGDAVKHQADLVVASWFSTISQIELADREHYDIVSEVMDCTRYENKQLEFCRIRYTFKAKS